MATGDYCTVSELKTRIWPDGTTPDNVDDVILASIVTAVSKEIANFCGRRFYTTDTTETRYFTTSDHQYLYPDIDIISLTSLAVDYDGGRTYSTTLDTDDYDLMPANASLDGEPYSWVQISPLGSERWPTHANGIKAVGYFGWSTTPAVVKEATLLQALRVWMRRNSPFGVVSNPVGGDMRLIEKLDPDVQTLLWSVKRWV